MALLNRAASLGRCPICGEPHVACVSEEEKMPNQETPITGAVVTGGAEPEGVTRATSSDPATLQKKEVEVAPGVTTTFLVDENDAKTLDQQYASKRAAPVRNKAASAETK